MISIIIIVEDLVLSSASSSWQLAHYSTDCVVAIRKITTMAFQCNQCSNSVELPIRLKTHDDRICNRTHIIQSVTL